MIKKLRFLLCLMSIFFIGLSSSKVDARALDGKIKLLVLIIASDNLPVYKELQKIWRSYMHLDREHVEVYFMKNNPNLGIPIIFLGDEIWCNSEENITPGLINKTITSIEALLPRIRTEFDYVLRCNLSSFYVFPKLLQVLENCPRDNFYFGSDIGCDWIASGCGFIISPDIAQLFIKHKHSLLNHGPEDDVLIGKFLNARGISLTHHDRMDFYNLGDWHNTKDNIKNNTFHFRIKNLLANLRLTDDIYIQTELLKMFYGITA